MVISGGIIFASVTGFFLGYLNEDLQFQTEKLAALLSSDENASIEKRARILKDSTPLVNSEVIMFDANFKATARNSDTAENRLEKLTAADKEKLAARKITSGVWFDPLPAHRRMYCAAAFTGETAFTGGILASTNFLSNEKRRTKMLLQVLTALVIAFIISSVFGFFISGWLTKPLRPIYDATLAFSKGDFTKRIDINTDDEIGRTAKVLNEMAERIDALIKTQRDFIADVSHEFKTPLTAIRGCAEAVIDGVVCEPEELKNYCGRIRDEALSLSALVNDLLEISRFESGTVNIEPYSLDLGMIFKKVCEGMELEIKKHNIKMIFSMPSGEPVLVMGEEKRLARVARNIVENAVRHSPDDARLKISAARSGLKWVISVSDAGPGVPDEFRERVFERFYRLDHSRSKTSGGTGLGLSICRKTIEALGGKISFTEPEPGFYCTLIFELLAS